MKKIILDKTKVKCPIIGFGAAPLGNLFKKLNNKEAEIILEETLNNNINFFDTSPFYGYGLSEKRLGNFFKNKKRDKIIVSTKVGRYLIPEDPKNINRGIFKGGLNFKPIVDYSYDGVMRSFEQSLVRLNLSYIDFCLIHDVDYFTHKNKFEFYFKQSLTGAYKALQKLKDQKLIKCVGLGLNDADVANKFLETEDFDLVLLAGRYTLLDSSAKNNFLETAENKKTDVIMAGVFNSGVLAKGVNRSTYFYKSIPKNIKSKYLKIKKLTDEYSVPIQAAAIQFPLKKDIVKCVVLGMDEKQQIKQNLKYLNFTIKKEFWDRLYEIL